MPKKVKVYDLTPYILSDSKGNWKPYLFHKRLAVIEGTTGKFILACSEGVHWRLKDRNAPFTLELEKVRDGSGVAIMPEATCKVTPAEIMDHCEAEEVELGQFVRRFGSRLEGNYEILLQSLNEIGLDRADYPRGEAPRRTGRR